MRKRKKELDAVQQLLGAEFLNQVVEEQRDVDRYSAR